MHDVWAGLPYPLGATYDGWGTNFALFSEVADHVDLCLFDTNGSETQIPMPESTGFVWHAYLPQVGPGQRYGYRVHGPRNTSERPALQRSQTPPGPIREGDRRRSHVEPGGLCLPLWRPGWAAHRHGQRAVRASLGGRRSGFRLGGRSAPAPSRQRVDHLRGPRQGIYGAAPGDPGSCAGTYAGLAHPVAIEYLRSLGVTAVELLPVHQFVHDDRLVSMGLRNYWGYNSIGFLAPHNGYARDGRGSAGGRIQGDGAVPACSRHRGHPRRGLQPHGGGESPGPDAVVQGHRQPGVLPAHGR